MTVRLLPFMMLSVMKKIYLLKIWNLIMIQTYNTLEILMIYPLDNNKILHNCYLLTIPYKIWIIFITFILDCLN